MKTVSAILFIISMLLFQGTISPYLFHGWQPDVFLVWIVVTTLVKGAKAGYKAGFIGGIIQDVLIGNLLGLHLFPYLVVVYIVERTATEIYEEQWYRSSLAIVWATFLQMVLQLALLVLGGFEMSWWSYLWRYSFPAILVNAILAVPVHYLVWSRVERESYQWL